MKQRRDTFANWAAENPVLLDGELGIVSDDPNLYKVGDGASAWNALPFRGFDGTLAQELGTSPNAVISQKVVSEKLSELSERIDNLSQGEKFNPEGNYPLLHVGTADTAIDLAGRGESVPASFGFRASGGKSIKDGRAYIKRIKGNSVVWNQLTRLENFVAIDADVTNDGQKFTVVPTGVAPGIVDRVTRPIPIMGHKYILLCEKSGGTRAIYLNWGGHNASLPTSIFSATDSSKLVLTIFSYNETETFTLTIPKLIDLTKMFGAGYEPTTIEEFNARVATLGIDMYAYNEGQVIHCNTESIKSVGDNAWDEEWIAGRLSTNTGQPNLGNNGITSKNYIRVLPNETYYCGYNAAPIFAMFYDAEYALITGVNGSNNFVSIRNTQFTTPANAAYMKFYVADNNITTYNHDIMITLVHSGWKQDTDAGYQPYWQDTLPLPIIRKYFPDGMKSAGSAHDEIRYNKASGKWEYSKGKIKSVDLGTFNWKNDGVASGMEGVRYESLTKLDNCVPATASVMPNILCAKYASVTANDTYRLVTGISLKSIGTLSLADTTIADVNALKASLQGVILYYESNDWEWVELDAEDQNFRDYYNVADFGTEEAISKVASTPFSADIIYQFNAVDMIREHEIEITELQSIIATMQAQLTSLINGGQ